MKITKPQLQLIEDLKQKFDPDITHKEMASYFKFDMGVAGKNVGGSYDFRNKIININYDDSITELQVYDTFFHEYGHLIHQLTQRYDYYGEYEKSNLRLSQLLESEQQATLIGIEFWKWKFPDKEMPSPPAYFCKEHVVWLAKYYDSYFENDIEWSKT
jgi:hypothetical protein